MLPVYKDGDYVFVLPRYNDYFIKVNQDIIFNHKEIGLALKRVSEIDKKKGIVKVRGINRESISSKSIGEIKFKDILGFVLFSIKT